MDILSRLTKEIDGDSEVEEKAINVDLKRSRGLCVGISNFELKLVRVSCIRTETKTC